MSKHQIDTYGHALKDVEDPRLERRINDLAKEYALVRDDKRLRTHTISLRTEVLALSVSYFRVVGQGMSQSRSSYDDTLIDTLFWCLDHLDPTKRPYTHFVRFKYSRMRLTDAKKEKAREERLADLDEQSLGDSVEICGSSQSEFTMDEEQQMEESPTFAKVNASVTEFLSLVVGFLEHTSDKAHSERAKLYLKMNFTEWTTYAIKVQPVYDWCMPFQNEERRIFATVENDFLDVYMADVCRTIRKLWSTNLKDGYGEIINLDDERLSQKNPPAPWKLSTSVHRDYLAGRGIKVSPAVISQHRKRFNELKGQLTAVG